MPHPCRFSSRMCDPPRPQTPLRGIKGWFCHIQQRVRNKRAWTLQMPPQCQSHCWNPFTFFSPLQKLIFASNFSLGAACEAAIWKDGPGCTHTGSLLWSQYFIISRSRDIYVSSELFFFFFKEKLHETLNRSISLFSSPFSPQQQQQKKQKTDLITAYH